MMPDIIEKRAKLPGQVVNVNAASRLRVQKRYDEIDITIDCLSKGTWHTAAEICLNNCTDIHVAENGYVATGNVMIKSGDNPAWWRITSSTDDAVVKIKTDGRVESSPAFPAAYTLNDDFNVGIYAPKSEIIYADGAFSVGRGKIDLHFVVTPGKEDILRELLHQSANDLTTPDYDVLSNCDLESAVHNTPLNDIVNNPDDIIVQTDAICWHQSLKTGRFSSPWDKYTPYMPALLLKTFKLSGLCEYGCRALLTLAYLNEIGESAKGLTKNDSVILRSLQSLLSCENI
ncbi:MAG: hypothetical protein WCO98_03045 [bacterium]